MVDQSARFVGFIPENYDRDLGPHIFLGYADDLTGRIVALQPGSVLELAAGTGIVTRKIRDSLSNDSHVIASDLNAPMLEVARGKFQSDEAIEFKVLDATNIEFESEQFDMVVSQFGVMFFPDKNRSYAEVHRVLKPGGSYVFNVWDSWDSNPFARITHETVAAFFPGSDAPGFYKVPFSYADEAAIRESLERAGFSEVTVEYVPLRSEIKSANRFANGLVFGNPLYDEIVLRGGDPQEICAAVSDAVERELGDEMSLMALVIHARKNPSTHS